jgi:hypothetical protein
MPTKRLLVILVFTAFTLLFGLMATIVPAFAASKEQVLLY